MNGKIESKPVMLRMVIPMKSIRLYSRMLSSIAEQKRELRKRVKDLLSQVNEVDAAEQCESSSKLDIMLIL